MLIYILVISPLCWWVSTGSASNPQGHPRHSSYDWLDRLTSHQLKLRSAIRLFPAIHFRYSFNSQDLWRNHSDFAHSSLAFAPPFIRPAGRTEAGVTWPTNELDALSAGENLQGRSNDIWRSAEPCGSLSRSLWTNFDILTW